MIYFIFQGPILGWVFGVVIRNKELWTVGVTNELIGLTTCVLIGKVSNKVKCWLWLKSL